MDKIICITGASSGIGLATARKFAREGWIVYAGSRNPAHDQQTYHAEGDLRFVELDVTDSEAAQAVAERIAKEQGRLDVLFCNAGIAYLRTLGQAPFAEIEQVFRTNLYGAMHMIRSALPLLRKNGSGHIIATSSTSGLVGQPMNEIYCASKFALEGLMESMATYYKPLFNIDVTLLEPGSTSTGIVKKVLDHLADTGGILEDEYKPVADAYMTAFLQRNTAPQSAASVAEIVWNLVHSTEKPLRLRTSEQSERLVARKVGADPTGLEGILHTRKNLNL